MASKEFCPCGSGELAQTCCIELIKGEREAETPEELMRSRYFAFILKKMDYILKTTDPDSRKALDLEANKKWAEESRFFKLEVLKSETDGNKGIVEFRAHYTGKELLAQVHHEVSTFRKLNGVWYYSEGRS